MAITVGDVINLMKEDRSGLTEGFVIFSLEKHRQYEKDVQKFKEDWLKGAGGKSKTHLAEKEARKAVKHPGVLYECNIKDIDECLVALSEALDTPVLSLGSDCLDTDMNVWGLSIGV
jgi:hypothetical protein